MDYEEQKKFVDELFDFDNRPIGCVELSGPVPPSDKWIPCDGILLDVVKYIELYNVIGYNYGGEGKQFKIPDMTFNANYFNARAKECGINAPACYYIKFI